MPALRLLFKLTVYYGIVALLVAAILWLFPASASYLPIGRTQALIAEAGGSLDKVPAHVHPAHLVSVGTSLIWLSSAILGALLMSLPVSWVYMAVRNPKDYDQSLIDTIVVLPVVVTSIVIIVQDSLALSFSLAGIAGAARFRNSMKSSGDLLFILLAIGMGLAAGIGAMELAIVTSIAFNLCFVALWSTDYGERENMKRYLGDCHPLDGHADSLAAAPPAVKANDREDDD